MLNAKDALSLIQEKLITWTKELVVMLPNFLLALGILVAGWLIARVIRSLSQQFMQRVTDSKTLNELVSSLIYITVILIGAFASLSVLNLDKTVTTLLAGAGIIGLALGFAFQDIASNFIAGVIMAAQRPLRKGELVETSGHLGTVERIFLRTTELRNMQGVQVIIPNKDIFQSVLVNYTRNGTRRVDLSIGVSYGEDLEQVKQVTISAVQTVPDVLPDRGVDLFYQGFGDSSIDLELRFWIVATNNRHFHQVRSDALMAVKAAFNKADITIPFPIRTLDFGIKGGTTLSEVIADQKEPADRSRPAAPGDRPGQEDVR